MTGVIATAQVDIAATPERVWASLTAPADIATYMEGARVDTTWQVGTPITWSGELNGHPYQDRGQVLTYDEPHVLSMTHFSPIMGQEDRPENYHTVVYTLSPLGDGTRLSLAQDNCADEQQAAQFSLHWQQMLDGLERLVEG